MARCEAGEKNALSPTLHYVLFVAALRCISKPAEVLLCVSYVPAFTSILAPRPRSLVNLFRAFFLLLPIDKAVLIHRFQ